MERKKRTNEERAFSVIESITLRPSSVPCFNFKKNGRFEKRTAIIAPIRFKVLEDGSIAVAWACSNGQECEDSACLYAKATKNKSEFIEEF